MNADDHDEGVFKGLFYGGNIAMFIGFAWILILNLTGNFYSDGMAIAVLTIFFGTIIALSSRIMRLFTCTAFVILCVVSYWIIQAVNGPYVRVVD